MAGIKESLTAFGLGKALDFAIKDPEHNMLKLVDWVDRFDTTNKWQSQRTLIRTILEEGESNNWYNFIMRILKNTDPSILKTFFLNFFMNSVLEGTKRQYEYREKYNCNIPWMILLDPTSACNLHCTGCWAADYGNRLNLSYDEIDDIINQGNEMGTYMFTYTGGEPLVRKDDLIKICEAHPDSIFLCFTNATLIDDKFAADLARVGNFVPAISIEGNSLTTDSRRGDGVYERIMKGIENLNKYHVPWGVSVCSTSENTEVVVGEEFIDELCDLGALFAWFFLYMPIGKDAPTDLMVTPEQRELMYNNLRAFRSTKPIFTMDFWHDGEFVYGCVAGGRYYLHINANGDIEPCVFCHYSDSNIREKTLLEAYRSPLFQEYHKGQPFSGNLLRPCPMLDNSGKLADMVSRTEAHSTDLTGAESAEELCAKMAAAAEAWKPVADRLWAEEHGKEKHEGSGFEKTILKENWIGVRDDYNTMVPETAKGVTIVHPDIDEEIEIEKEHEAEKVEA